MMTKISTLRDKLFSFTDKARRKAVQDFLGDDFSTIKGILEHHPFLLFKKFILPILGIFVVIILYYYTQYASDWLQSSNKDVFLVLKYLFLVWKLFLLYLIFLIFKVIYNTYVDYKNDFIIFFKEGIYFSDKNGVFHHSQIKVPFESIHAIKAIQHGFFCSMFGFGSVFIETTGNIGDIDFIYCKHIKREVKKLRDLHSEHLSKNDLRGIFKK